MYLISFFIFFYIFNHLPFKSALKTPQMMLFFSFLGSPRNAPSQIQDKNRMLDLKGGICRCIVLKRSYQESLCHHLSTMNVRRIHVTVSNSIILMSSMLSFLKMLSDSPSREHSQLPVAMTTKHL